MEFYKGMLIGIAIGVISVMFIIPILQQLESVIVNALEIINGYSTRNVTKRNSEIAYIQAKTEDDLTPVATNAIGYEVPNDEYIYGDECNKNCSDKQFVGFH